MRKAEKERKTKETQICVRLNLDGQGKADISTGIKLLDHILELFAFHGLFDLEIEAKGDIEKVDIHHTNEDIGQVLGLTFREALKKKNGIKGIKRFGFASVAMENVLATVALDISGRGFFRINPQATIYETPNPKDGYELTYAEDFLEKLALNLGMNLNLTLIPASKDLHTVLEPVFKALGLALDQATTIDPRRKGVPSTKGIIDL